MWDWGTHRVWVYREKIDIDFLPKFFPGFHTCVGAPKKNLGQKPNVKFFRVYTYLWGTFNLGFAKMTKFDTFGHISPCRWGRRGKKLIKPEYILGQGPTQKNWAICRPVCREINFFTQNIGMFDWLDTWTYVSQNTRTPRSLLPEQC